MSIARRKAAAKSYVESHPGIRSCGRIARIGPVKIESDLNYPRLYDDTVVVDEPRSVTIVGLPAPAHLPGPLPGDSYARKYPPKIDEPVIIELVPAED